MSEERYFGRVYELVISQGDNVLLELKAEPGKAAVDIKFDISFHDSGDTRKGTISILGLKWETICPILHLSALAQGNALRRQVHIRLDAGYMSDAGVTNIFNGYVWWAQVSSPPEMWLTMKVSEANIASGAAIRVQTPKDPIRIRPLVETILKQLSDVEGVKFILEDHTEDKLLDKETKNVAQITFHGLHTTTTIIRYLSEYLSDEISFMLLKESKGKDNGKERVVVAVDKKSDKADKNLYTVDANHGLLSVTGIDVANGTITTFLDGTQPGGQCFIKLTSILNPQANGKYKIIKKQYKGHFKGKEWYAILTGRIPVEAQKS